MKFSIITCTWNSAATLPDTIASVNAQKGVEVEHIFVDGGSKDATLEQIAGMSPHSRVLHDVGGGISRAMNDGIRAASGEVIAHLHSDDYYRDAQVLSDVAGALNGGAQWAVGHTDLLINDRLVLGQGNAGPITRARYVRGAAFIPHPAVFVRRDLFERAGFFDERLRYAMDIDLWMRMLPLAEPALVKRALAVFREHAGSVSTANVLAARREELTVRLRYAGRDLLGSAVFGLRYLRRVRRLRRELEQGQG